MNTCRHCGDSDCIKGSRCPEAFRAPPRPSLEDVLTRWVEANQRVLAEQVPCGCDVGRCECSGGLIR